MLKQLLNQNNYLFLNKILIKSIGLEETIILGEFIDCYDYYEKNNLLKDDYFFYTYSKIREELNIKEDTARKAIRHLQDLKIIDIKKMGIPCKTYYKINDEQIKFLIDKQEEEKKNIKFKEKGATITNTIITNTIITNKEEKDNDIFINYEYCKNMYEELGFSNFDLERFYVFYKDKGLLKKDVENKMIQWDIRHKENTKNNKKDLWDINISDELMKKAEMARKQAMGGNNG